MKTEPKKITLLIVFFFAGFCMNMEGCASLHLRRERPAKAYFTNSIGMSFNKIPAGIFMMGSPEDEAGRKEHEILHQVTLTKNFYMQTTEVTQGQWKAVMGDNPSKFKDCGDNCPIDYIWSDIDIQSFLEKLNSLGEGIYRLPTEAEWEYAARAGTTTPFNTGNCISTDEANFDGNNPLNNCPFGEYRETTLPVASFSPNAWGLYDMHGNVTELVQDDYGKYSPRAATDPAGPENGFLPVWRGGNWSSHGRHCRSAARCCEFLPADARVMFGKIGLRIVLERVP